MLCTHTHTHTHTAPPCEALAPPSRSAAEPRSRSFPSVELHGRTGMAGSRRLVHFFTALCVFLCCSAPVNGGKRGNSDKCSYKVKNTLVKSVKH